MLFTSLPIIKSGNIPLIVLAAQAPDGVHPCAWPGFYPQASSPPLPCIASKELKDQTSPLSIDLWLPTPTVPLARQPNRRLFVAWSISVEIPPSKYDPNDPNYDLSDWDVGWTGAVNGPQFQVRAASVPSRPVGSALKFSSAATMAGSLSVLTPSEVVHKGGSVTEITPVEAPAAAIGEDALCYLRIRLPYRTQQWTPASAIFYVRGLAVDQW